MTTLFEIIKILCVGFTAFVFFGWIVTKIMGRKRRKEIDRDKWSREAAEADLDERRKAEPDFKAGDVISSVCSWNRDDPFVSLTTESEYKILQVGQNEKGHWYYLVSTELLPDGITWSAKRDDLDSLECHEYTKPDYIVCTTLD